MCQRAHVALTESLGAGAVILLILQMRKRRQKDRRNGPGWELLCPATAGLCVHVFSGYELSESQSHRYEPRGTTWDLGQQPFHFAEDSCQDLNGHTAHWLPSDSTWVSWVPAQDASWGWTGSTMVRARWAPGLEEQRPPPSATGLLSVCICALAVPPLLAPAPQSRGSPLCRGHR